MLNDDEGSNGSLHWSSRPVIEIVCSYFKNCSNVLDVGSGRGDFVIHASKQISAIVTGVEVRKDLHEEALLRQGLCQGKGVFINQDVREIDFSVYDAVYYYNPFCEYIAESGVLDDLLPNSDYVFHLYTEMIATRLEKLSKGSKMVCHHTDTFFIPACFELIDIDEDNFLSFWLKVD